MTTASHTELRLEVEDFLYHEARLLDERRFHEWLDLFTEDLVYWMPTRSNRLRKDIANEIAQPDHLAYFNDDLTMLKGRVARLDTEMASTVASSCTATGSRRRSTSGAVTAMTCCDGCKASSRLRVARLSLPRT